MTINWNDYGISNTKKMPTDWQPVISLDEGDVYGWATLNAFYSPTARRYFWGDSAGCSCSSWGGDFDSEADFQNGTKADLTRAVRTFGNSYLTAAELLDALEAVLAPHQLHEVPGGQRWCLHCGGDWPCPTVAAITEALS